MKTFKEFIQSLIVVIFTTSFLAMNAQEIPINVAFSSDTTFNPFNGEHDVYSFKMTGGITFLSDSSLVRVVLTDHAGNHWLVYEAYPLIDTLNSFSGQDVCDETCFLDKITPDSIRVDIINAIVSIEKFTYDLNEIQNVRVLQEQQKWVNDSIKIAIMNQRIQQDTMYWRAGRSALTQLSFSEKEIKFGYKFNIFGFDFYKGGIFELRNNRPYVSSSPTYVSTFNWRYRHGAIFNNSPYYDGDNLNKTGWLTAVEDQFTCNSCWVFTSIGAVEAIGNLFYNKHTFLSGGTYPYQLDVDLSELELLKCYQNSNCSTLGWPENTFGLFENMGVHNNGSCINYSVPNANSSLTCPNVCTNSSYLITTISETKIDISSQTSATDNLKKALITRGPLTSGLSGILHAMVLFGYKVNQTGDTVYHGSGFNDPDIIIESNSPLDGTTNWYFKNSLGVPANQIDTTDWIFPFTGDPWNAFNSTYSINGVTFISLNSSPPPKINCSDDDGDGYYWWGIHTDQYGNQISPKQCGCPPGVKAEEEDCDDHDSKAGPYELDQYNQNNWPLYTCIPNDCATLPAPLSVCSTCTPTIDWSKDQHIKQNIIIEPGYTLTITAQVFFTPGAKIYISPDAGLLLTNSIQYPQFPARLTSSCSQPWSGIQIGGDPLASQDPDPNHPGLALNQGTLFINNGIIENAICGVRTLKTEYSTPDFSGWGEPMPLPQSVPSGGIIQATNTIFRNNRIGVEFYPYKWSNGGTTTVANSSCFYTCTFTITDKLVQDAKPQYLLKLDGVNAIPILSCTFNNLYYSDPITHEPYYNDRGNGIYSYNSLLNIGKAPNSDKSRIENLKYGIYAMASGLGTSSVNLHDIEFSGNKYGSYFSGFTEINPFEIKNNNFKFTWNFEGSTDTTRSYGLYLNDCSGFNVSLNTFNKNGCPGSGKLIGLIVNNSGGFPNIIYNNVFNDLTFGLHGQNKNWDCFNMGPGVPRPEIQSGLCFICNIFDNNYNSNCTTDIGINSDVNNPPAQKGIVYHQRNIAGIEDYQKPAGNDFSLLHGNQYPNYYDININASVQDILYSYHYYCPSNHRTYPEFNLNDSKVHKDPKYVNYYPYDPNNPTLGSCPANLPVLTKEELNSMINLANNKIDSLVNLLNLLVDDGSTDTLLDNVENSTPNQSYSIYQSLMNPSPFLSDTVLKTSIEKEDVLPNAMIRDIMVANPQSAKNDNLLNAVDNRTTPMPDSMWSEILDGRDTIGAKEHLEWELAGWIQSKCFYFKSLMDIFLKDTVNSCAHDCLVSLLRNADMLDSKYYLIFYYINSHDFNEANNILDSIPLTFSLNTNEQAVYNKYAALLPLLQQLISDTLGYLIPDSIQTLALQDLESEYDMPGAFARNILIASGLMNYNEPIILETTLKSSRPQKHYGKNVKISDEMKIYPNPCKDFVIVEYSSENSKDYCSISIIDQGGREVASISLNHSSNQVVIPLKQYSRGSYFIQLNVNGKKKEIKQIILIE